MKNTELFDTILGNRDKGERKSFERISNEFSEKIGEFNPTKNHVKISEYFGDKLGNVKAVEKLIKNNKVSKEKLEYKKDTNGKIKYRDFRGLYIFLHKDQPFYVGISRSVVNRILQHVKTGKSHYSASLAYKIACLKLELEGKATDFKRSELDYHEYIKPVQEVLMDQNVAFLPIADDEEMYLFEVYCSLHFDTKLNKFTTT
jgi:hypothetical protein